MLNALTTSLSTYGLAEITGDTTLLASIQLAPMRQMETSGQLNAPYPEGKSSPCTLDSNGNQEPVWTLWKRKKL
jgi:hypothetical protein